MLQFLSGGFERSGHVRFWQMRTGHAVSQMCHFGTPSASAGAFGHSLLDPKAEYRTLPTWPAMAHVMLLARVNSNQSESIKLSFGRE